MIISLRLSEEDAEMIKNYARIKNMSVSELIRTAIVEKIEDEIDYESYTRAIATFQTDPETYTLDEVEKELGI